MSRLALLVALVATTATAQTSNVVTNITRVRYAPTYATGGDGTSASPWTGWSSAVVARAKTFFPPGYYGLASVLTVPAGATIQGSGPGTVFVPTASFAAGSFIRVDASSVDVADVTLADFSIDSTDYAILYPVFGSAGASSQPVNMTIRGVTFRNGYNRAITLESGANVKIIGCTFDRTGWNGGSALVKAIAVGATGKKVSTGIVVANNTFKDFGGGAVNPPGGSGAVALAAPLQGASVYGNTFLNFNAANNKQISGIYIGGTLADMPKNVSVTGNSFSAVKGAAVTFEASDGTANCNTATSDSNLVIAGNAMIDVGFDSTATSSAPGIYVCNGKNVIVAANTITDPNADGNGGIELHTIGGALSANNVTLTKTTTSPASTTVFLGGTDITASGNTLRGGAYGINTNWLRNATISGNTLIDQLSYAIFPNPTGVGNVSSVRITENTLTVGIGSPPVHGIYVNSTNQTNSEISRNTSTGFATATVYLPNGIGSNIVEFNRNSTTQYGPLAASSTDSRSWPSQSGTVVVVDSAGTVAINGPTPYLAVGADNTYVASRAITVAKSYDNAAGTCRAAGGCSGGLMQIDHTGDGSAYNQDGFFVVNRHGATGTGGYGTTTAVALGGYQELRGNASSYSTPSYGSESATTLYNTGTLANGYGASGACQVAAGGNGSITTCVGVNGSANVQSGGTGTMTTAKGVYGSVSMGGSGTITDAYGGNFDVLKSGGGTVTNAHGVTIGPITVGSQNNWGLEIGAVSGGSNINAAQRWNGSTSGYIYMAPTATADNLSYTSSTGWTGNMARTNQVHGAVSGAEIGTFVNTNTYYIPGTWTSPTLLTTAAAAAGAGPGVAVTYRHLSCVTATPIATGTWAFTLNVAGTDRALTCSMSGGGTSCSDTAHTYAASSGAAVAYKMTPTSTPTVPGYVNCTVTYSLE